MHSDLFYSVEKCYKWKVWFFFLSTSKCSMYSLYYFENFIMTCLCGCYFFFYFTAINQYTVCVRACVCVEIWTPWTPPQGTNPPTRLLPLHTLCWHNCTPAGLTTKQHACTMGLLNWETPTKPAFAWTSSNLPQSYSTCQPTNSVCFLY